jgi:lysophospholipase L1-like esterase
MGLNMVMKKILVLLTAIAFLGSFKKKELTWVAIGDSITYLNNHTDETANRLSKGYLTRVVEELPYLHYQNKGYNGWTSGDIARHIDTLGLNRADIYSIFLGTNDWWSGRPVGSLEDYKQDKGNASLYGSFRIIINKVRALNPQAKIILIAPMQRADFVYILDHSNNAYGSYKPKNGQYLEAFANAIDSIGQFEKIPVIDLYQDRSLRIEKLVKFKRLKDPHSGLYVNYTYQKSKGIPFNPKTDEYPYPEGAINMTYDGLHPSDKGDSIIANNIIKIFKKKNWLNRGSK